MDQNDITHFMPAPIKVVCADDSETMRRLLNFVVAVDPELEVCYEARNGREAVIQYQKHQPDVVLLDVEMPLMNGIEAAAAIRKFDPRIPIVMFSTLTSDGMRATLEALTRGATDHVAKPPSSGHMSAAFAHIQNELIPKIKRWGRWYQNIRLRETYAPAQIQRPSRTIPQQATTPGTTSTRRNADVEVVGIGVSTGGPVALTELLKEIPEDFTAPILITQHMPASFTKVFAERLNRVCKLEVFEAVSGVIVEPGQVWIAPGDQHMVTERVGGKVRLQLHKGPLENSCRPSVDVMFRSIATTYRERALAIILTGMGQDGLLGCRQIRESGGRVFAQDESSSVVWGMPKAVVKAGLADRVVPLTEMAHEIMRVVVPAQATSKSVRSFAG